MMETEINRDPQFKNEESDLRASEAKWRELAETAPDNIISIGPDGKILFLNRVIAKKSKDEVIGRMATDFVPEDHAPTLNKALKKVFSQGVATEYEIMGVDKNKNPAWYHTRVAPVIANGKVISATLITRDITERKHMEVELREARDLLEQKIQERTAEISRTTSLLQATLESTADGVMVMDLNRQVILCNDNFLKLWPPGMENPYERSDGHHALQVAATLMTNPEEILRNTEAIYKNPAKKSADLLKLKDGRLIERVSNPQLLDGEIIGRVWSYRDVTLQLRAEAERDRLLEQEHHARLEAEQSVRGRDVFLAMASHELRTPLTPLKMYLDWFKREARKMKNSNLPKGLLKSLDYTDREVQRLIQLTDDLLDVTRITAGRLTLRRAPMDLLEMVTEVYELKKAELEKNKCDFKLTDRGPIIGNWDYNRLDQVFNVILNNAIKYGAGKPIEVSVFEKENKAYLTIRDYGVGILGKDLEKIFLRFERAESIKNFEGLGLGLFIAKEILTAHGGTIRAESEIEKGSTFTVSLPI